MRTGLLIWIGIAALAGTARADDHLDRGMLESVQTRKLEPTYAQQIADRLTWLGDEMDAHLGKLSFDRIAIRFDGRARRAKIRLGKGDGGVLSMRIDGDVALEHGLAHVNARIDLTVNGLKMRFDLPMVDLVPSSYEGEPYLEVRLPIISGTFEPEDWFH